MEKTINEAEKALQEEYAQMQRSCGMDGGYASADHPNTGQNNTVNSIGNGQGKWGNVTDVTGRLKPEEALKIAIERVLSGGAPINNGSFYDEINWNLSNLGFPSKLPLDIKQAILKLIDAR